MRTRGKRVTAEATVPREVLIEVMRVEPERLSYHLNVATIGAFFSGAAISSLDWVSSHEKYGRNW